jgi:hypothetical protein
MATTARESAGRGTLLTYNDKKVEWVISEMAWWHCADILVFIGGHIAGTKESEWF